MMSNNNNNKEVSIHTSRSSTRRKPNKERGEGGGEIRI